MRRRLFSLCYLLAIVVIGTTFVLAVLGFVDALMLLVVTIPLGLVILFLRQKKIGPGVCAHCGYDLRASTGSCPECGAPIRTDRLGRIGA